MVSSIVAPNEMWAVTASIDFSDAAFVKRATLLDRLATDVAFFSSRDTADFENFEGLQKLMDERIVVMDPFETFSKEIIHLPPEAFQRQDVRSRYFATALESEHGVRAVPFLEPCPHCAPVDDTRKLDVLRVVLSQLPVPGPQTTWQDIVDWRNDEEVRRKYLRLRTWMNRAGRGEQSARELVDELASSLAEYDSYMSLRFRKFSRGRIEVVVSAIAEILDDLTHVRLASAVERLFSLGKERFDLLESEFSAPGRELAYISEVRQRFG
jgi:hypothetical protein